MVNRSSNDPLSSLSPSNLFHRALVRHHRQRIASSFRKNSFLKDRSVIDLINRLKKIRRTFATCADIGCHTGQLSEALEGIIAHKIICTDLSYSMVQQAFSPLKLVIDEEFLPFKTNSLDLIVSALSLHWVNDLPGLMSQVIHSLKPDGLFLASLFGENTLKELRDCLSRAEIELKGGLSPRFSPMISLQDAGTLLQRAGFALPVVDMDHVQVSYARPMDLLQDLRGMGETNALNTRSVKFMCKSVLHRACELYQQKYSLSDGRIYATFDILTLTGWKPHESQPKPLKPGSGKISLANYLD